MGPGETFPLIWWGWRDYEGLVRVLALIGLVNSA